MMGKDRMASYEEELESEHERIVYPLLRRLIEVADRLEGGERVSAEVIEDGLRLWDRYVLDLDAERHRRFPQAFPPANGHELCQLPFDDESARSSFPTARSTAGRYLMRQYRSGYPGATAILVRWLRAASTYGESWIRLQEDHAFLYLDRSLETEADRRLYHALKWSRAVGRQLEAEVRLYLDSARTDEVEPALETVLA